MTNNELELLDIIRSCDNPQLAAITAIDIICQYIRLRVSSPEPPAVDPLGFDGIVPA